MQVETSSSSVSRSPWSSGEARMLIRSSRGMRAAVADDRLEEGAELLSVCSFARRARLVRMAGADEVDDRLRPAHELLAPLLRRAEQLADHDRRQRVGELGDRVHASLPSASPRRSSTSSHDRGPQRLEHPGREAADDQPAQARVLRRIRHRQHPGAVVALHLRELLQLRRKLGDELLLPAGAREALRVLVHGEHVVEAGHDPLAPRLAPVHRILPAEPRVGRVRIGEEGLRAEGLVELSGERRSRHTGDPRVGKWATPERRAPARAAPAPTRPTS